MARCDFVPDFGKLFGIIDIAGVFVRKLKSSYVLRCFVIEQRVVYVKEDY